MEKIIVTSCEDESFWYSDRIGEEFVVADETDKSYEVKSGSKYGCILKKDAEFIS